MKVAVDAIVLRSSHPRTEVQGREPLISTSNSLGSGQVPNQKLQPILRKEVIQPQVPLRLPCYDFTPVADPTVDAFKGGLR